jgi:hypothetical protein
LTYRQDFCQNAASPNKQTAKIETRWYQLFPASAGFLRKVIREQPVRQGNSAKAKQNERKLGYENSENYVHDSPVVSCLLWALSTAAKRTNG